jgi:protein-tyrosine-phosphatase
MNILLVDETNTEWSIMACASLRHCLIKIFKCSLDELEKKDIRVNSAGLGEAGLLPAHRAVGFCQGLGIGITRKRSIQVGSDLLNDYDLIYAKNGTVRSRLLGINPEIDGRIHFVGGRSFLDSFESLDLFEAINRELKHLFDMAEDLGKERVIWAPGDD